MMERELSEEWARSQLEGWAEGSLTGESRERMAVALGTDPKLRAAAERAVAVQRALRSSPAVAMPAGLRRRLLAIPGGSSWPSFALPVAIGVAAAVVAVAIGLRPSAPPPSPSPVEDPRVVAIQEFELAMRYLQKTARITQNEVTNAVGSGFRDAVAVTRAAAGQETSESGG